MVLNEYANFRVGDLDSKLEPQQIGYNLYRCSGLVNMGKIARFLSSRYLLIKKFKIKRTIQILRGMFPPPEMPVPALAAAPLGILKLGINNKPYENKRF